MSLSKSGFEAFFTKATGESPFPFQRDFAVQGDLPSFVDVPTGLGKTAMAVLGWLWRRRFADRSVRQATPRRLVYCLPMRVLVEQTRDNAIHWLDHLDLLAAKADGAASLAPAGSCATRYPQSDDDESRARRGLLQSGAYAPPAVAQWNDNPDDRRIAVYVLMGGEDQAEWDLFPEHDAIIIGTQDMLLSRALNRGYAATRARWPMQFGLLNTDSFWVFDEIQLMGSGLATTAQLEAFRRRMVAQDGNRCQSVWMSATLRPSWLKTVDFKDYFDQQGRLDGQPPLSLTSKDREHSEVKARWSAAKGLSQAASAIHNPADLAEEVCEAHKPGTRTIVVVNTVRRACALFDALNTSAARGARGRGPGAPRTKRSEVEAVSAPDRAADDDKPRLVLLHSRFRPADRARRVTEALADPPRTGTIIVSTQVIEAGVDVSAVTLFTELAPWASMVQRFGRCNRRGECNDHASVRWIDVPDNQAAPYEADDLKTARRTLEAIGKKPSGDRAVGPAALSTLNLELPFTHSHVIRHKDLVDLFDTTPDLAGNDIDIDRYVREVEETDVRVFWRTWQGAMDGAVPPDDKQWRRVTRVELCPAAVGEFRTFASQPKPSIWRWNYLAGKWTRLNSIVPGQVYLVRADTNKAGKVTTPGYDPQHGWGSGRQADAVDLGPFKVKARGDDEYDADGLSMTDAFESIADHTNKVCEKLETILSQLNPREGDALRAAARWHDLGKAHDSFQVKIADGQQLADSDADGQPQFRRRREGAWAAWAGRRDVAKAPGGRWNQQGELVDPGFWPRTAAARKGFRRHFRHELASALAVLQRPHTNLERLSQEDLNLVAYLIAAHHGKVRLSIRSMPNELRPPSGDDRRRRFARGVWDDDKLPPVDLGGGFVAPEVPLSLEPMEIGLCEAKPFQGQPSWLERMLRLRDTSGPFRLAYLEALLRAADCRASAAAVAISRPPLPQGVLDV